MSISQCSWNPGTQENIVAITSPTNAEGSGNPIAGTVTTTLNPGRIAGIVVGSIVGLLFIVFLAFLGKRKLTTNLDTELHRKPAANDASFLQEDDSSYAKVPELDGGSNPKPELDSCTYPGAELEARREIQEMKSNGEVGHELLLSHSQVSELPS